MKFNGAIVTWLRFPFPSFGHNPNTAVVAHRGAQHVSLLPMLVIKPVVPAIEKDEAA